MRRFTIRGMMLLTLLVAVFFALPFRQAQHQKQGREWVAEQRGHVSFKYDYYPDSGINELEWVPKSLLNLLGVDFFNPVHGVIFDCDTLCDLRPIVGLKSTKTVFVNIDLAEDIDFEPLKALPRLELLRFSRWSGISESQYQAVTRMLPNVEVISDCHDKLRLN